MPNTLPGFFLLPKKRALRLGNCINNEENIQPQLLWQTVGPLFAIQMSRDPSLILGEAFAVCHPTEVHGVIV